VKIVGELRVALVVTKAEELRVALVVTKVDDPWIVVIIDAPPIVVTIDPPLARTKSHRCLPVKSRRGVWSPKKTAP
jgi:uncharacterized protein YaiI (UPF0178 family)